MLDSQKYSLLDWFMLVSLCDVVVHVCTHFRKHLLCLSHHVQFSFYVYDGTFHVHDYIAICSTVYCGYLSE